MNEQIKQKIQEYYQPTYDKDKLAFYLNVNGEKKYLGLFSRRPIFLGFGETATSEQEAMQKGFVKTTAKELFKTFYPEEWEKIKYRYEDVRTEEYLNRVKANIGLIDVKHGWDEEKIQPVASYKLFMNTSSVDVGRTGDGKWVAQYWMKTDIDDYDITRFYFERQPSKRSIMTAQLVEDIETFFELNGYDKVYFTCWECGRKLHWLDLDGDIHKKWGDFQEKYCGC